MKKIFIVILAIIILILGNSAKGTIIHIPGDYLTIQEGIDSSLNGDTVLVQPGTYYETIDFCGHNITLGSPFLITGDTNFISQTIIDADLSGVVIAFEDGENNEAKLIGFTIQNGYSNYGGGVRCWYADPFISFNNIINNEAYWSGHTSGMGGGIFCDNSNPIASNNKLKGNIAMLGGGICCWDSSQPELIKNVIYDNAAYGSGGGFCSFESVPNITNSTIARNSAAIFGGSIYCENSDLDVINSTLWSNTAGHDGNEIYLNSSSISITNSDIQNSWEGEGNIDADPMFVDPENGDFHLMAGSPCIDAGDPDSPLDPDSTRADMGAYYYNQLVDIDDMIQLPFQFYLSQNYPNPFNASTIIKYELPQQSQVEIEIYDILGRRISTLRDGLQPSGYHQVIWNDRDISSGVYFYKLQAGDYIEIKKMMLIK